MGVIIFNGISSLGLHIQVQHPPEYVIPEKDYEIIHVPGRNGDIVINNDSWQNVDRTYDIAIDATREGYSLVASRIAMWLHSASGYARLEDSYEPDYYRLAMYKSTTNISNIFMKAGEANISFDCKPQRFLKSGELPIVFLSKGRLRNPTEFFSFPKIKVIGSGPGQILIENYIIDILRIDTELTIDSLLQDIYYDITNCNSYVALDEFPRLIPGENDISFSGKIISLEITPRWWIL